jgi:c(7)-type cytochrome triheme protein
MTTTTIHRRFWRTLLATVLLAAAAQAAGFPKLPAKFAMPKGEKSPGIVIFNHATHIVDDEPNCIACHPRLYSILQGHDSAAAKARPPLKHEQMDRGESCGVCHGKTAFKFKDHCELCHN